MRLRARKTFTPRLTDFLTDFEKKTDCFAVYLFNNMCHVCKHEETMIVFSHCFTFGLLFKVVLYLRLFSLHVV